jgi:phage gp29-like protein
MLYDSKGNKIDLNQLQEETATASVGGIRQPTYSLPGILSPYRLADTLRSCDQGDVQAYITLANEIELKDLHYSSVLETRKLAVSGLPFIVEAVTDDKKDVEIRDAVNSMLKADFVADLCFDLLDSLAKGFAVVELIWAKSPKQWTIVKAIARDQRHFQFDANKTELRLRDMSNLVDGLELNPYKFAIHMPKLRAGIPLTRGVARTAAFAVMIKTFNLKDWAAFSEKFGMPLRVGKYPANASDSQKRTLLNAVLAMGHDAGIVIPDNMMVDLSQAQTNSDGAIYEKLANYVDKQVSKLVLGGTMTADDGSSLAQAKVHNEVRRDRVINDARQLASTITRDIVIPFVDLNFGKQEQYPICRFDTSEPEDLKLFADSLAPFIDRGLKIEASQIRDKFGLDEPAKDAEVLTPQGYAPQGYAPQGYAPQNQPSKMAQDTFSAVTPSVDKGISNVTSRTQAVSILMTKMLNGEALTPVQERFLLAAEADQESKDDIDKLIGEPDMGLVEPIKDDVVKLLSTAKDAKQLVKELDKAELDTKELGSKLSIDMFKSRILGALK